MSRSDEDDLSRASTWLARRVWAELVALAVGRYVRSHSMLTRWRSPARPCGASPPTSARLFDACNDWTLRVFCLSVSVQVF